MPTDPDLHLFTDEEVAELRKQPTPPSYPHLAEALADVPSSAHARSLSVLPDDVEIVDRGIIAPVPVELPSAVHERTRQDDYDDRAPLAAVQHGVDGFDETLHELTVTALRLELARAQKREGTYRAALEQVVYACEELPAPGPSRADIKRLAWLALEAGRKTEVENA